MKPVITGTQLADSACWFRYYIKHEKYLDLYVEDGVVAERELGTLIHETQAAHELGKSVTKALKARIRALKAGPGYKVLYSKLLTQLELEALSIYQGATVYNGKGQPHDVDSYSKWRATNLRDAEVLHVEERFRADVGPVILAPRLDLVLGVTGWTGPDNYDVVNVEIKTTTRWEDANWLTRWQLDPQTTIQQLALQAPRGHGGLGAEHVVTAVMPITYSRQQRKNVQGLQKLSKVKRLPLKWVIKPEQLVEEFKAQLGDFALELQNRREHRDWPKSGLFTGACRWCSLKKLCKAEVGSDQLRPTTRRSHAED